MDPQSIVIGAAAFVISAILIYLITAFTMKEKTFEEVIEEQRRRQEAEREQQKTKKSSDKEQKEYKKKFRNKKEKSKDKQEKPSAQVESESSKDQKMVNLEIEPEIIEPVETVSLNTKKSKNKKAKSILVNKDEKPVVAEKAKELYHKEIAPKDEIELHHEQQLHKPKDKQHGEHQSKSSKKHEKSERIEKERSVRVEKTIETVVEVQKTRAVMSESEVKSARAKGGVITADTPALNGSKLIQSVKAAHLKDSEIQTLIEILLNRQGISTSGAAEWNKKSQKGDPMSLLKRQLEEKERALQEEQNLAMSASSKVKEVRQELSTEKVKFSSLEKRYQEKIARQNQDIEALHARMQSTHQQHQQELGSLQNKMQHLESAGDRSIIQKLQEEKKILTETIAKSASAGTITPVEANNLKQKVSIMEKELGSNAIKLNASENAKKTLETKLAKYEEQLKKHDVGQKEHEVVLTRKMEEVNQELRRAEARNDTLANDKKKATTDLSKANDALNNAQKEVSTLKSKLQELEKHLTSSDLSKELEAKLQTSERMKQDLEGNLKNLEKQLSDSRGRRTELETEVKSLKQENYALAEEMKTTKERQAGEGQEAPTAPAGAPNGDVKEKSPSKQQIELKEHEKILSDKLSEITRLSSEVESQKGQVSTLQGQLDAQKKKNNDLREKNWKAMEALEKAEKSASVKVDSAVKSSRDKANSQVVEVEAQDKGILQRLFPDISLSQKLGHSEWMSQFEKQASTHITTLSSKSAADTSAQSRVADLESANTKLQSQVEEYKKVVGDTESKLQQLEKSVESEEKRWKEQLKQAQSELKTSSSRVSELERSVQKHQSETEKIQTDLSETKKRLQASEANGQTASNTSEMEERCYQLEIRLGELEDSNKTYESQVEQYRSVLAITEDKLSQLESKAETEESRWQERVTQSQTDLKQSKIEVESLKEQVKKFKGSTEDLSDLSFAYGIVEKSLPRIIEEMEVKVASLESQLKASEDRCLLLQKETEEAQTQVVTLKSQVEITKDSSDDLEALRRRIKELEVSVEAEKKKGKELSMNVVKLNGIIKTGQDALKQEQETVQKLSDQLNTAQGGRGGGGKELKELRSKLADKEKQLEREMSSNKHLSQQLTSSGNDMGTSV